jgi:LemA protein
MGFVVLLIVLAVLAFWVVGAYNGLIGLKNQVANAWKQIDVQLKRRHDLIPNLVNTVKGAMQFERETLQAVVEARNKAVAVSAGGGGPAGTNVAATAAAESQLTGALGRLFAVVEAYPDLKATGNVAQLQEELTSTENKIAFARQLYNDTATQYNTRQRQFPTMLVAGLAAAAPAELWEITDGAERENVTVDLSMGSPPSAIGPGQRAAPAIPAPPATAPAKPTS